jgi:hypothetical protein
MSDKFIGRWFWCELCDRPAIKCTRCDSYSCTGGGCSACHDDFEEVARLFTEGKIPKKDGLPIHPSPAWAFDPTITSPPLEFIQPSRS